MSFYPISYVVSFIFDVNVPITAIDRDRLASATVRALWLSFNSCRRNAGWAGFSQNTSKASSANSRIFAGRRLYCSMYSFVRTFLLVAPVDMKEFRPSRTMVVDGSISKVGQFVGREEHVVGG